MTAEEIFMSLPQRHEEISHSFLVVITVGCPHSSILFFSSLSVLLFLYELNSYTLQEMVNEKEELPI